MCNTSDSYELNQMNCKSAKNQESQISLLINLIYQLLIPFFV